MHYVVTKDHIATYFKALFFGIGTIVLSIILILNYL